MRCPLCYSYETRPYHEDRKRRYQQCSVCDLVFVVPEFLPDLNQEKHEYDLHQNNSDDEGYRRFLERLLIPVANSITPPARGLDYGCGPGPVLADLFRQRGYEITVYDPIYFANPAALENRYKFVTASEVVEHFHCPAESWLQLSRLIEPGGLLGVMTKRVINAQRFAQWHYKNDITHVSFYSDHTMHWLASKFDWQCEFISQDIVLFRVNQDD